MGKNPVHRYKELRLGQLRAFCECIRKRSFSAAARALHMSQPAVWLQVRALERDLGVSLLHRHGRALEPSEDGQVLLELASSVVGAADSLKEAFDQRRKDVPRTLTVIGSPGVLTELLAQPIVEFCQQHPNIKVALLNYASPGMLDLLIDGEADMAVLPLAMDLGGNRPLLVWEPLAERSWVLLLPTGHPLAGKRRVTLADLVRYPLILPAASHLWRQRVDEVFRAAGLAGRSRVSVEVDLPLAARRYVSLGLGIALRPKLQGGMEFPNLCTRSLGDLLPTEQIVIFWRRGVKPRSQARQFADYARRRLLADTTDV